MWLAHQHVNQTLTPFRQCARWLSGRGECQRCRKRRLTVLPFESSRVITTRSQDCADQFQFKRKANIDILDPIGHPLQSTFCETASSRKPHKGCLYLRCSCWQATLSQDSITFKSRLRQMLLHQRQSLSFLAGSTGIVFPFPFPLTSRPEPCRCVSKLSANGFILIPIKIKLNIFLNAMARKEGIPSRNAAEKKTSCRLQAGGSIVPRCNGMGPRRGLSDRPDLSQAVCSGI